MKRRFRKVKKLTHPTLFLPHPKLVLGPKMTKNGSSMSCTIGKPMEMRFKKYQFFLTCPTHVLPHPKTGPGMTQYDVEPKNVQDNNF